MNSEQPEFRTREALKEEITRFFAGFILDHENYLYGYIAQAAERTELRERERVLSLLIHQYEETVHLNDSLDHSGSHFDRFRLSPNQLREKYGAGAQVETTEDRHERQWQENLAWVRKQCEEDPKYREDMIRVATMKDAE